RSSSFEILAFTTVDMRPERPGIASSLGGGWTGPLSVPSRRGSISASSTQIRRKPPAGIGRSQLGLVAGAPELLGKPGTGLARIGADGRGRVLDVAPPVG